MTTRAGPIEVGAVEVGAVVVGAGVVGLAVARELALAGHAPLVIEAGERFGLETSSRNSGVIHAGLYYPPGSLKARLCVAGRERLYAFCAERGVPHRRTGKLVFAGDAGRLGELEAMRARALAVGAGDCPVLGAVEVARLEPALACAGALLSPATGIVDAPALMAALLGEAEAHGARLVTRSRVGGAELAGGLWRVRLAGEAAPVVAAPLLVNAAGLGAQALARAIEPLPASEVPALHLARGVWFAYSGRVPFSRLIYPLPEPGGLGTHLTLDLAGNARFGPDVEWVERPDYRVDEGRKAAFVAAARAIWPGLDPERLHPADAGIRPKLAGPGEPNADFVIAGPESHGLPGLVNLFGIESPGLTAALAIGEYVAGLIGQAEGAGAAG